MFKSIKRLLVAATAILVLSAPSAAFAIEVGDGGGGSASGPVRAAVIAPASRATASSHGFQWGDAGVGAASIVVLLAVGVGAASVLRHRRVHRLVVG
jgi:hypothetical protein